MTQVYILNKQIPADYFVEISFVEKQRKPLRGKYFRLFCCL